ncbi:MAG: tryptophan--tRNA ligase, partial [Bifidobacterium crudilactis]|nr:tryptophan--tRNA ligase [Bifidobacterium crudilactis]
MTDERQLTAAGNEMSASFLTAKKLSDATLSKLEQAPGRYT